MARYPKKAIEEIKDLPAEEVPTLDFDAIEALNMLISGMEERINALEKAIIKPKTVSINKVEEFNGEVEVQPYQESRMRLNELDKLQSAANAVKILPPNLLKEGRHSAENIGAICGFLVTPEMMDKIYENFKHEA